jgi:hypothetical protein
MLMTVVDIRRLWVFMLDRLVPMAVDMADPRGNSGMLMLVVKVIVAVPVLMLLGGMVMAVQVSLPERKHNRHSQQGRRNYLHGCEGPERRPVARGAGPNPRPDRAA